MARPTFGDKDAIQRLDLRNAILKDGIAVPRDVLPCRFCGAELFANFDDTWIEGGHWGAGTIQLNCVAEPDIYTDAWRDWMNCHEYNNQSEQMEEEAKVAAWLDKLVPGFRNEA